MFTGQSKTIVDEDLNAYRDSEYNVNQSLEKVSERSDLLLAE